LRIEPWNSTYEDAAPMLTMRGGCIRGQCSSDF